MGASAVEEVIAATPAETEAVGRRLAARLAPGEVVLLLGPLGAGKTRLVAGLAAGLGIDPTEVHSPSFTLVNEYTAPDGLLLVHADGYRLPEGAPLDDLGLEEAAADGAVVAIEWPRGFTPPAGMPVWRVAIEPQGEARRITLTTPPDEAPASALLPGASSR